MPALFTTRSFLLTRQALACAVGIVACASFSANCAAQGVSPKQGAGIESKAAANLETGVRWEKLSPAQQQALKPIQADWSSLDVARKKKWLAVAQRYATLPAADQTQIHSRMQTWSQLSPAQRQNARDSYTQALSSPRSAPTEGSSKANLNEQWVKYQALPAERRAALQAAAEPPKGSAEKTKPLSPSTP